MKYVPPYGRESEGDDAQYINGNPATGVQGSIPPANAFEHPMREIVNVISKSKFIPDTTDLLQMTKSIRSQRLNFIEDAGSANNLAVTYDPPIGTYTPGLLLRVRIRVTNTGSVNIDAGAGSVPVRHMDGSVCNPGDLPAGGIAELCYDGTVFQLVNFLGEAAAGTPTKFVVNIAYCVDQGTTNHIIAPFSPAIATADFIPGFTCLVKIANTTTGPTIIDITTEGGVITVPVLARGTGGPMNVTQGDMLVGDVILFHYDGTVLQMVPNSVITTDTILNVPSQFADPQLALRAVERKFIAQNATVYIQLAQGIFQPFYIFHPCSDRIVVKGTMKIPGTLGIEHFQTTGNQDVHRYNDSEVNRNMLRTRFGTEIVVPAGQPGVMNVGPGSPLIQDILFTGLGYNSGINQQGITLSPGYQIRIYNCAFWGLKAGVLGGGDFNLQYAYACGCWSAGFLGTWPGNMSHTYCISVGNIHGFYCNQNCGQSVGYSHGKYNKYYGIASTESGYASCQGCVFLGNGDPTTGAPGVDIYSNNNSFMTVFSSSFQTTSPAPGVTGNNGSFIAVG